MAKLSRYIRLVFASEYALLRYKETGSSWWEERYLTVERERLNMIKQANSPESTIEGLRHD